MNSTTSNIIIHSAQRLENMSLEEASREMSCLPQHAIGCVNWPHVHSYCPQAEFSIAHSCNYLFISFHVVGEDLRAVNSANLSPVAQDSCVEFFMQVPGSPEYWNFEFNCIGTVNASHRIERPNAIRLNDEQIASILRYSTCGNTTFEEHKGIHEWNLIVAIPLTLVGIDFNNLPQHIMANVYKCGDATSHPHYVSLFPINTERPNFHQPQYFGPMILE